MINGSNFGYVVFVLCVNENVENPKSNGNVASNTRFKCGDKNENKNFQIIITGG